VEKTGQQRQDRTTPNTTKHKLLTIKKQSDEMDRHSQYTNPKGREIKTNPTYHLSKPQEKTHAKAQSITKENATFVYV
jgi:hypothetical protein